MSSTNLYDIIIRLYIIRYFHFHNSLNLIFIIKNPNVSPLNTPKLQNKEYDEEHETPTLLYLHLPPPDRGC